MFEAIRTKHRWDRLSSGFCLRYAWDTLDNARFFHKGRIEFGGNCIVISGRLTPWSKRLTASNDFAIISRKS